MEGKYEKLRISLTDTLEWPHIYMYKFIIKGEDKKAIAQVQALFNTKEAQVTMRESSNGKFVSITAKELMLTPEDVINRYKMAEGIEGLLSL